MSHYNCPTPHSGSRCHWRNRRCLSTHDRLRFWSQLFHGRFNLSLWLELSSHHADPKWFPCLTAPHPSRVYEVTGARKFSWIIPELLKKNLTCPVTVVPEDWAEVWRFYDILWYCMFLLTYFASGLQSMMERQWTLLLYFWALVKRPLKLVVESDISFTATVHHVPVPKEPWN